MNIDTITTYPVKSTSGIAMKECQVLPSGLRYDRNWALFDENLQVITARDFPQLLGISAMIEDDNLLIFHRKKQVLSIAITIGQKLGDLKVFKENARGHNMDAASRDFFSAYLGVRCFLAYMGSDFAREVLPKYGGKNGDVLTYADECPLLLISDASLGDLNQRLDKQVSMQHFRPNLTVEGCEPYEEDTWKKIRVGQCEFEVSQQCKRCVFTTIDPLTQQKSSTQEPLRTLSSYRKHPKGGVPFGVHLIPRKTGKINIGDKIEVIT